MDPVAQAKALEHKALTAREEQRRKLRAEYPDIAAFVDECRKYFGNVKVIKLEKIECKKDL